MRMVKVEDRRFIAETKSALSSLAMGTDGQTLAAGYGGIGGASDAPRDMIQLWTVATGKPLKSLTFIPSTEGSHVAFLPDGKTLCASGSGKESMDARGRLWLFDSGITTGDYAGHFASAINPADPSIVTNRKQNGEPYLSSMRFTPRSLPSATSTAGTWQSLLNETTFFPVPEQWRRKENEWIVGGPDAPQKTGSVRQDFPVVAKNLILSGRVTKSMYLPNTGKSQPNLCFQFRNSESGSVSCWFNGGDWFGLNRTLDGKAKDFGQTHAKRQYLDLFERSIIALEGTVREYADGELISETKGVDVLTPGAVHLYIGDLTETCRLQSLDIFILDDQKNVTIESAESILLQRLKETAVGK